MAGVLRKILQFMLIGLFLILPACGGDGSAPVEQVTVALSLTGPVASGGEIVGSVQFDLVLPNDLTLSATQNGSGQWILDDGVINWEVSGTVVANYTPQTPSALGRLRLSLITVTDTADPEGFNLGRLVTIVHDHPRYDQINEYVVEDREVGVGVDMNNLDNNPAYNITISIL